MVTPEWPRGLFVQLARALHLSGHGTISRRAYCTPFTAGCKERLPLYLQTAPGTQRYGVQLPTSVYEPP